MLLRGKNLTFLSGRTRHHALIRGISSSLLNLLVGSSTPPWTSSLTLRSPNQNATPVVPTILLGSRLLFQPPLLDQTTRILRIPHLPMQATTRPPAMPNPHPKSARPDSHLTEALLKWLRLRTQSTKERHLEPGSQGIHGWFVQLRGVSTNRVPQATCSDTFRAPST